jgi:hypothetical protein
LLDLQTSIALHPLKNLVFEAFNIDFQKRRDNAEVFEILSSVMHSTSTVLRLLARKTAALGRLFIRMYPQLEPAALSINMTFLRSILKIVRAECLA